MKATFLAHRVQPPTSPRAASHPTVIMLHGRGADENDLLGLAPYLDDRLLILSVRAPYPFQYGGGFAWYDMEQVGTPEPTMFKSSYDKLITFVNDAVQQYPVDPERLFLFGFSMGTVMSYALALSRPALFRGVAANSGYVPEGTHLTYLWDQLSGVGFSITHGIHDPVIPVAFARRARDLFARSNAQVTYKEYPMGHQISEESLNDVARWLTQRIDQTREPGHA